MSIKPIQQTEIWLQAVLNASRGNVESRSSLKQLAESVNSCVSDSFQKIASIQEVIGIVLTLAKEGKWYHSTLAEKVQTALRDCR